VDFFARKIRQLRPGLNPQSWVPEASMLTTRPPNPLRTVCSSASCCYLRSEQQTDTSKTLATFQDQSKCSGCIRNLTEDQAAASTRDVSRLPVIRKSATWCRGATCLQIAVRSYSNSELLQSRVG
jgi:hypothetical protein